MAGLQTFRQVLKAAGTMNGVIFNLSSHQTITEQYDLALGQLQLIMHAMHMTMNA
jgi:hypothetical protein